MNFTYYNTRRLQPYNTLGKAESTRSFVLPYKTSCLKTLIICFKSSREKFNYDPQKYSFKEEIFEKKEIKSE